jgi:hypothetical protein
MNKRYFLTIAGLAAVSAFAQPPLERRADISGGGDREGKCTIEVVVDGTAEVEIRGDRAVIRNLTGQRPQWRRFVCNAPMPANPAGFRFKGIDGRGRQNLVRSPEGGGAAVVRIEDPQGGSEGYTFDVMWAMGGYSAPPPPPPVGRRDDDRRDDDRFYRDRDDFYRGDWRAKLFGRVRQDLDYVSRYSFRGDDRYRLADVYRELDDLQRDYASGRWDRRALSDVIGALDRVLADNRLAPRDRDALRDDQSRLRELRDRRRP